MTRKSKNKGNKKNGIDGIEVLSGRELQFIGSFNTAGVINIMPSTFARALQLADVFQFYRFTSLRVTLIPVQAPPVSAVTQTVIGYAPGAVLDNPPTSYNNIVSLPKYVLLGGNETCKAVMNLNRKDLLSHTQLPWFKTIIGTEDTQFEIQANLYYMSNITAAFSAIIDYTVEFQSPNLAANSPMGPMITIPLVTFQKMSSNLSKVSDDPESDEDPGIPTGGVVNNVDMTKFNSGLSPVIDIGGFIYKRQS